MDQKTVELQEDELDDGPEDGGDVGGRARRWTRRQRICRRTSQTVDQKTAEMQEDELDGGSEDSGDVGAGARRWIRRQWRCKRTSQTMDQTTSQTMKQTTSQTIRQRKRVMQEDALDDETTKSYTMDQLRVRRCARGRRRCRRTMDGTRTGRTAKSTKSAY